MVFDMSETPNNLGAEKGSKLSDPPIPHALLTNKDIVILGFFTKALMTWIKKTTFNYTPLMRAYTKELQL